MDNKIQGIIMCSGNATRYAVSAGRSSPYPKHLERIGGSTILERSADGLIRNIPVSGITFTLNPQFREQYLALLRELQRKYSDVPFSYLVPLRREEGELVPGLREEFSTHSVHALDGRLVYFGDPIVAIEFGDTFVNVQNTEQIRRDIQNGFPELARGRNIVFIGLGLFAAPRYFHLGRLSKLTDDRGQLIIRCGHEYGMRGWNVNTVDDLIQAKIDLGYPLTEDETRRPSRRELGF